MRREIKFRALFEYLPTGERCWQEFRISKGFNANVDPWKDFMEPENWKQITEWEQYTGLKDKNGTEIYEGDITHIGRHCKIPREIIYSGSGFFVRRLNRKPNVIYDMTLMCECPSITIIGNVYENPELLK